MTQHLLRQVEHTLRGPDLLRHFLFNIAAVPADWRMENVLEEEMAKIAQLGAWCSLIGGHLNPLIRLRTLDLLHRRRFEQRKCSLCAGATLLLG